MRRTIPLAQLEENSVERKFVNTMVSERLFNMSTDSKGTQLVSVTHEVVLRAWPRIIDWTESNRALLRIRSRVEQSFARWQQEPDDSLLLARGVALREAVRLAEEAPYLLDQETNDYIRASRNSEIAQDLLEQDIRKKATRPLRVVFISFLVLIADVLLIAWAFAASFLGESNSQEFKQDILAEPRHVGQFIVYMLFAVFIAKIAISYYTGKRWAHRMIANFYVICAPCLILASTHFFVPLVNLEFPRIALLSLFYAVVGGLGWVVWSRDVRRYFKDIAA